MARKRSSKKKAQPAEPAASPGRPKVQLPRDALTRVDLGQAFAEYDHLRTDSSLLVRTPAIVSALDPTSSKLFFVGRRGTGKTAMTFALANRRTTSVYPEVFSPLSERLASLTFENTHDRPYRTLIAAFKRALHLELLRLILSQARQHVRRLPHSLQIESRLLQSLDFDLAALRFIDQLLAPLGQNDEEAWLREIKKVRMLGEDLAKASQVDNGIFTIIIDRVDDSWDGSPAAVTYLVALMHACLELSSHIRSARALMFLRENVFERVRAVDNEFARLETCVVGLDWTREQLIEMIERRLNRPFRTRLAVDGTTWTYFFEKASAAQDLVCDFCQYRPRDVLTYCSFAIDTARAHKHSIVKVEDLQDARKRFSDSRLKDLGDEYSENYPQISQVLARFYGLGSRFTLSGAEAFIQRLLVDTQIKDLCGQWIYDHIAPEQFVRLFYDIGFWGFDTPSGTVYRSLGPRSTVPPAITQDTELVVHPSYGPALDLRNMLITTLDDSTSFARPGLLTDLPGALNASQYKAELAELEDRLKTLPTGISHYREFEEVVGEILRLCFYRWLSNIEPQQRDCDGTVVRDWLAANRARDGFWEMVRTRYQATQVVWECKNCVDLDSHAFQQIDYYLRKEIGYFGVIAFRGESEPHDLRHIKRIAAEKDAIVILLGQRDLMVFIRQSRNGKIKEGHIQDIYDKTVRGIS